MLPNPLHPAVVHFPIVLAFLLPFFVGGAIWATRRGANSRRAWAVPLACSLALAFSAWAAVETGGAQSERVERIVSERAIESHEEMAEALLATSAGIAVVALVGLAAGMVGTTARVLTAAGSLAAVALVARVGHSGGELVYRYGAASAYTSPSSAAGDVAPQPGRRNGEPGGNGDER